MLNGSPGTVHPHVRGEYLKWEAPMTQTDGPPPRAWGIPAGSQAAQGNYRSTPTCVGNTSVSIQAYRVSSVHPHVRGEYTT